MGLRTRRTLALALAALVVASACGGSTTASPTGTATVAATGTPAAIGSSPAVSASPSALDAQLFASNYAPRTPANTAPHGTLVVGSSDSLDTLNPWFSATFAAYEAMQPAMRGFVAITSDGKYLPDLATSVPTVANGGVVVNGATVDVTITLKPNLKWSDGTPLTMDDLVATWKWVTDPGQGACYASCSGYPDIGSIDESGDRLTATVHFKRLYTGWLGFLTIGPWPAKYLTSVPTADASALYPLSSAIASVPVNGPFRITHASRTEVDYAPNPHWTGGVSTGHAPYLAGLKLIFYDGNVQREIADFLAGRLDLAIDLAPADYPSLAAVEPGIGRASADSAWAYEHLDLNNDPDHRRGNDLWDPAVRQALAMAINKPDLISSLFPGLPIQPACSPVPPGLWYGVAETCPAFDARGAQAALAAAGLTFGPSGNVQYRGKDIDLEMCTTTSNLGRLTALQKVQRYLAAVHVKSHLKTVSGHDVLFASWAATTPTTDCSLNRGTYDVALFAYVLGGIPDQDYYPVYSTDQWPDKGDHSGHNSTRFSDPTMDAALTALETAVDLQAQRESARAVQDAYLKGTPEIPLYYRASTTGIGVHAGNWPGYGPAASIFGSFGIAFGPLWNVEDWYYQ